MSGGIAQLPNQNPATWRYSIMQNGDSQAYFPGDVSFANSEIVTPLQSPFNAIGDGVTNDTVAIKAAMEFASANNLALDGVGKTYAVSSLVVNMTSLAVDNMTLKEALPNAGDPITVLFNSTAPRTGKLLLGENFKVDRSGSGLVGTLNVSCGIKVQSVGIVLLYCEVFGNARGNGILVDNARWFLDETYVHDMRCDMSGVIDDIQHGVWARYCDNVKSGGYVHSLGNVVRTGVQRDRYNRGKAYGGCGNIWISGVCGPGVDQTFDVTGNARTGNTCVKLMGAHSEQAYSAAFKFANGVICVAGSYATANSPGLCGVLFGGPSSLLVNMTSGGICSGFVQIGGGENGQWTDTCVVKLDRNSAVAPTNSFPKGITVTNNRYAFNGGNATTFTVLNTNTLAPTPSGPLNAIRGQVVRLTTTGTLPTPLALATDYFLTFDDSSNVRLSTTWNNAQDGVFITGYTGGSGVHTMTMQNKLSWGVFSNVDGYDAALPNLVYGNQFGGLVANSPIVQPLQASVTNGAAQAIASAVSSFINGSAKTDPYSICNLTGGTSGGVLFTVPLDGNWKLNVNGLWTGGAGTGTCQMIVQINTGGGFVDVLKATRVMRYPVGDTTQFLEYEAYLSKGTTVQVKLFQDDAAPRNFTLRDYTFNYQPTQ